MKKIILASQSPRRKQLLNILYPKFDVCPSNVDERFVDFKNPGDYVTQLAKAKAENVAKKYKKGLVIGADTIVVLKDDLIFGKPTNEADAIKMLQTLSDNWHSVYTGVCVIEINPSEERCESSILPVSSYYRRKTITYSFAEETRVHFRELDQNEIEEYVKTGSPMDKAGAYGIQDNWGAVFVDAIEGDYNTVVGFPLQTFYATIKEFFPEYLPLAR